MVVLLDDAGFAGPSSFGGVLDTPVFDRLASEGLRYNRFHTTAVCSPTRAALLSGRNHHRLGFGTIPEGRNPFPGYNCTWPKTVVSVAEVLRRNGYSTSAFGKWHNTPEWEATPAGPFDRWPTGLGFEYFYGFLVGETSQWEPPLYRNTTAVEPPKSAAEGYQLTTDMVNDAIAWVHSDESLVPDKPFFLYLAPGATHVPHHVAETWIEKYKGRFDQGWDALRAEIFARQKKIGTIPADAELTPRPPGIPAWNSLSAEESRLYARQMEVYAGFMAQTDYEIGRLMDVIRSGPNGDNTLVMYIAGDNGASAMEGVTGRGDRQSPNPETVDAELAHMSELGGPARNNGYAAGWAWMNNTPFQWTKLIASHFGATRNSLVVNWPRGIKDAGTWRGQFTHIIDVTPTLYEVAGIEFPKTVDGIEQVPLDGISFAYSFDEPLAASRRHMQYFENWGNRAMYRDGWIASAKHVPVSLGSAAAARAGQGERWELYNVDRDFSQAHDLAAEHPEKLQALQQIFNEEAHKNQVYPNGGKGMLLSLANPSNMVGRNEFVFYPDMPRLFSKEAPDFSRSHRLVVKAVIAEQGAEGVLVSNGCRFGGFVMYVKGGRLVYENNWRGKRHDLIECTVPLPYGEVELTYEFAKNSASATGGGTGRLFVNGRLAGEAILTHVASPWYGNATFNIGRARIPPVSTAYDLPFTFTGTIEKITIKLM